LLQGDFTSYGFESLYYAIFYHEEKTKRHSHMTLKSTKIMYLALQIIRLRYLIDLKSVLEERVNVE
jgi:hypothetical protein